VFSGDEMQLNVGFNAAQAGLAELAWRLAHHSLRRSLRERLTGLARVGPLGSVRGMSRLVEVQFRDLVIRDETTVLTLRVGSHQPWGRLFSALDADITLTPALESATLLRLAGAYRPPLGPLGAGIDRVILHQVAAARIWVFIRRIADAIAQAPPAAETPTGVAETPTGE